MVPFADPECDEGAVLMLIRGGALLAARASWKDRPAGECSASRRPWEVFTEKELAAIFHHACASLQSLLPEGTIVALRLCRQCLVKHKDCLVSFSVIVCSYSSNRRFKFESPMSNSVRLGEQMQNVNPGTEREGEATASLRRGCQHDEETHKNPRGGRGWDQ